MTGALAETLQGLQLPELRRRFLEQGQFLFLIGHKQGGSVSRHSMARLLECMAEFLP
ncbi:MAG: hypothetical protein WAU56_02225 [Steroidobacteraceae bacterium]